MPFGFNTPAPEKIEAPKLASSGLAGYEHEIKLKDGQTAKMIALHPLDDSFQINVHKTPVNYDGLGFRYIPAASKNTHLDFLATPVKSPFESDPDPKVRNWKTARYMLVFVVDSPNEKLKGHVGYLELRDNYMRKDGSYNVIQEWQEQSEESVEGHIVTWSRTGKGVQDTSYKTTVLKSQKLTAEQMAIAEAEVPEIQEYIIGLYRKEWNAEEFQRVYDIFQATKKSDSAPASTEVKPSHPVASEQDEIPF